MQIFVINEKIGQTQTGQSVATNTDGMFAVAFTDTASSPIMSYVRVFDANHTPVKDAQLLGTTNARIGASVATRPDKSWVTTWVEKATDGAWIKYCTVSTAGDLGTTYELHTGKITTDFATITQTASVVADGDKLVTAWIHGTTIEGVIKPLTGSGDTNTFATAAAANHVLSSVGIAVVGTKNPVVMWIDTDGTNNAIKGALIDTAAANAITLAPFNVVAAATIDTNVFSSASIAMLTDGKFVVTYTKVVITAALTATTTTVEGKFCTDATTAACVTPLTPITGTTRGFVTAAEMNATVAFYKTDVDIGTAVNNGAVVATPDYFSVYTKPVSNVALKAFNSSFVIVTFIEDNLIKAGITHADHGVAPICKSLKNTFPTGCTISLDFSSYVEDSVYAKDRLELVVKSVPTTLVIEDGTTAIVKNGEYALDALSLTTGTATVTETLTYVIKNDEDDVSSVCTFTMAVKETYPSDEIFAGLDL